MTLLSSLRFQLQKDQLGCYVGNGPEGQEGGHVGGTYSSAGRVSGGLDKEGGNGDGKD